MILLFPSSKISPFVLISKEDGTLSVIWIFWDSVWEIICMLTGNSFGFVIGSIIDWVFRIMSYSTYSATSNVVSNNALIPSEMAEIFTWYVPTSSTFRLDWYKPHVCSSRMPFPEERTVPFTFMTKSALQTGFPNLLRTTISNSAVSPG